MTTPTNHSGDMIIAAIHKTRERISDTCKGDIRAISAAARNRQEKSGRITVSYAKESEERPTISR